MGTPSKIFPIQRSCEPLPFVGVILQRLLSTLASYEQTGCLVTRQHHAQPAPIEVEGLQRVQPCERMMYDHHLALKTLPALGRLYHSPTFSRMDTLRP